MEKLQEIINRTEDFLSYLRQSHADLSYIAKCRLSGVYGSAIYDEDLRRECHELGEKVDELGKRVVDQDNTIRRYANRIDYLEKQLKQQQRINEELEYFLTDEELTRIQHVKEHVKEHNDSRLDPADYADLPFPEVEGSEESNART